MPFELIDRIISLALTLHKANTFLPVLKLNDRDIISDVVHAVRSVSSELNSTSLNISTS